MENGEQDDKLKMGGKENRDFQQQKMKNKGAWNKQPPKIWLATKSKFDSLVGEDREEVNSKDQNKIKEGKKLSTKEWVENNFQKDKLISSPANQNINVVGSNKADGGKDKSQEAIQKTPAPSRMEDNRDEGIVLSFEGIQGINKGQTDAILNDEVLNDREKIRLVQGEGDTTSDSNYHAPVGDLNDVLNDNGEGTNDDHMLVNTDDEEGIDYNIFHVSKICLLGIPTS